MVPVEDQPLRGELKVADRRFCIRVSEVDHSFVVLEWQHRGENRYEWRILPLARLHHYKSTWSAYLAAIIAVERHITVQ